MSSPTVGPLRVLLGRAVILTLATGGLATVVAGLVAGGQGVLGALLALALVLGFLLLGQLPLGLVARGRGRLGTALLVLIYTARLVILLMAFRTFSVAGGVDRTVLGLTVIACALAWTIGAVWSALLWRPMVVDPDGGLDQRC